MSKPYFLVPLLVFIVLVIYFALGLTKDPRRLPNMLAEKPVPHFNLKPIKGRDAKGFNSVDLTGNISLVNIFGSWCVACRTEHPLLMKLAKSGYVAIHGIDWREENPNAGLNWLQRFGDPYTLVGDDPDSRAAIAFGVTGAPETFLVDAHGIIRHKITGPITKEIWETTLEPMIDKLRNSSTF